MKTSSQPTRRQKTCGLVLRSDILTHNDMTPLPKIRSRTLRRERLSDIQIDEMFELFQQYYANADRERFRSDLNEKSHVIMYFVSGRVAGFSTLIARSFAETGKARFLFSGDTVLRKDIWGMKRLKVDFGLFVLKQRFFHPFNPFYYMLISKGFKTYLLIRKNLRRSYPNCFEPTPETHQKMVDFFYRKKFGDEYHAEEGLIRYHSLRDSVKGGVADPTLEQLKDPDIAYFVKRNPRYAEGEELACIAEVQFADIARTVLRHLMRMLLERR